MFTEEARPHMLGAVCWEEHIIECLTTGKDRSH